LFLGDAQGPLSYMLLASTTAILNADIEEREVVRAAEAWC
jgi:hypothetical protein